MRRAAFCLCLLLAAAPMRLQGSGADAWRDYGIRLLSAQRPKEAVGALERSLKADPSDPKAWAALGNAHWAQGRKESALQAWKRSLALEPANPALAGFVSRAEGKAAAPAPVRASAAQAGSSWLQRGLRTLFVGLGVAVVALF